jgi:hypothetical protein
MKQSLLRMVIQDRNDETNFKLYERETIFKRNLSENLWPTREGEAS